MQVLTNYSDEDFETNDWGRLYYSSDFEVQYNQYVVQLGLSIQEYGKYYFEEDVDSSDFISKGFEVSIFDVKFYDQEGDIVVVDKKEKDSIIKEIRKLLKNG